MGFVIEETFRLGSRGLVVLLQESVEQPNGYRLHARILTPDGFTVEASARREFIRRTSPEPEEREAFLLEGLVGVSVPIGSTVEFEPVPDWGPE